MWSSVWENKHLTFPIKITVYTTYVVKTLPYGSESRTTYYTQERALQVFDLECIVEYLKSQYRIMCITKMSSQKQSSRPCLHFYVNAVYAGWTIFAGWMMDASPRIFCKARRMPTSMDEPQQILRRPLFQTRNKPCLSISLERQGSWRRCSIWWPLVLRTNWYICPSIAGCIRHINIGYECFRFGLNTPVHTIKQKIKRMVL